MIGIDIPSWSEIYDYFKDQLQTNEFFAGFLFTGILAGIGVYFRNVPSRIYRWSLRRFTTQVTITSEEELFHYFMIWLGRQEFSKRNRNFGLISTRDSDSRDDMPVAADESSSSTEPLPMLTVYKGTYLFRHRKKFVLVTFDISDPVTGGNGSNWTLKTIQIHYIGKRNVCIDNIIHEVMEIFRENNKEKLTLHTPGLTDTYWSNNKNLPHRSMDSMILPAGDAESLIADMQQFFSRRQWYNDRGIPYHRGYLFYGPPGTGKSSMAYALASKFNRDVYYMSMSSSMTDNTYLALMGKISNNSILVMEDVDCLFEGREADKCVSFSTLLNSLDGFCATNGTVLIMTTNYIEKLDAALIRDGRADIHVRFNLCIQEQIVGLFKKFFPDQTKAEEFARRFPDKVISPAEVQGMLMKCNTVHEALQRGADWVNKRKAA